MRFEVLGTVDVHGDTDIRLTAPKQRLLLAILVSRANLPNPTSTLIASLWPDAPPGSPGKALEWHVRQLRRTLTEPDRIRWCGDGYALDAEPDEIDAAWFEHLLRNGQVAMDRRSWGLAVTHFTQAIELWRGPAYGSLALTRALAGESARLNELRLQVTERRARAQLQLNRYESVIADLTGALLEHPLRESTRELLIIALYRSGRQFDALATYRSGRDLARSRLGLEPSPRLQELHRAILKAEPC